MGRGICADPTVCTSFHLGHAHSMRTDPLIVWERHRLCSGRECYLIAGAVANQGRHAGGVPCSACLPAAGAGSCWPVAGSRPDGSRRRRRPRRSAQSERYRIKLWTQYSACTYLIQQHCKCHFAHLSGQVPRQKHFPTVMQSCLRMPAGNGPECRLSLSVFLEEHAKGGLFRGRYAEAWRQPGCSRR